MLSLNNWAKLTLATICLSFFLPTDSYTLSILPFSLLCFACIFKKDYFNSSRRNLWCFLVIISILNLMFHGLLETKNPVIELCCLGGVSYLSSKFEFTPKMIIFFLFFCILPVGFYHLAVDGGVRWIPVDGEYLNIIGGNTTKHGTAMVGLMLMLSVMVYYYELCRQTSIPFGKKMLACLFIFALYLMVFSSRSVLLAGLMFLIYLYLNKKKFHTGLSIAFFAIANASVFFLEYLSEYVDMIAEVDWLADLMRADNFGNDYGVTSGRAWLWNVHINSFLDSPYLMGGGRATTDFSVNDWIPWLGEEAHAGSESAFTGYLSGYGLVGIGLISIFVGMFLYAAQRKNMMASAIMFCMIYNTTMGVTLVSLNGYGSIFCYFLYFTCIRKRHIYENK